MAPGVPGVQGGQPPSWGGPAAPGSHRAQACPAVLARPSAPAAHRARCAPGSRPALPDPPAHPSRPVRAALPLPALPAGRAGRAGQSFPSLRSAHAGLRGSSEDRSCPPDPRGPARQERPADQPGRCQLQEPLAFRRLREGLQVLADRPCQARQGIPEDPQAQERPSASWPSQPHPLGRTAVSLPDLFSFEAPSATCRCAPCS